MAKYQINNKEDAFDFANKLLAFVGNPEKFQPITIEASFGKQRSNKQNKYYWLVLADYVAPYFAANPVRLVQFILNKVMQFSITPDFVHEMFKIAYLNSNSTTSNNTKKMSDYTEQIRHDFYHDYQITIPEPREENDTRDNTKDMPTGS
jgi:hypothetical protein